MSKYRKEQILEEVKKENVEFIHLQFTDIMGVMKNISITSEQLKKAINNEIMFDGSSIDGFVRIEESDMYLRPDLDTFRIFPWTGEYKEARFICDIYNSDGTPFSGCPRNTLKRIVNEARQMGYTMNVGPECEFFLFHTDEKGEPSLNTHDNAGYFDLAPADLGGNARKDMIITLKKMGFNIEASHHENAPGQHEIDFEYDDAITTADNIMTFKMVVRIVAQRHGLHATFMPKPKSDMAGSGMHLNISLAHLDGKNAFYDRDDKMEFTNIAYNFLGGLITHAKAFTAITNPTVNSYKRLVPGYEAPVMIAWAEGNRSPLIRIPSKKGSSTRIELRSPDPSANPYLALAVTLNSGIDGIKKGIRPIKGIKNNLYDMEEKDLKDQGIDRLPTNLKEALIEFAKDEYMKKSLGTHLYKRIIDAGIYEWNEYSKFVSTWEVSRYLRKF